ncbi:hypothetical protein BGZ98_009631 [Dissophora globulifera]|nr:hypothetical protein BGZ98_009631 [Dissophora globulifera]
MLSRERPLSWTPRGRNSIHGESSSSSALHNTVKSRKRHTQQFSSSAQPLGASSLPHSQSQQQNTAAHSRHRSVSITSAAQLTASPDSVLAKEKEFMANTRILAMSNLIDSFASGSHAKQGFYGKQLKIIGSTSAATSTTGAELDLIVKVTHVDTSNLTEQDAQEDLEFDLAQSRDDRDASWIQATAERTETISPVPSPTFEQRSRGPNSTSSVSSYSGRTSAPQTHLAVISNALCFVTNRAGDYIVQLSIHAPYVAGTGSRGIHLSYIPKCRSNFIQFRVLPANKEKGATAEINSRENMETIGGQLHVNGIDDYDGGFEFNVHPAIMSLDDAHLNPNSDEDAQFWLEVQELLVGHDQFVKKLVISDDETLPDPQIDSQNRDATDNKSEIAGCFPPSSSLHISWMSRNATNFVQDVEQDISIQITGLPDQTKSSTLLQDRKRKDPEDSNALDPTELEEEEYEHLEMDDGDLVITVENTMTLNVQKLGWKQPFVDISIELPEAARGHATDLSLVDITGDAVQEWEAIDVIDKQESVLSSETENLDKDSTTDLETASPSVYRVWFFTTTEGSTQIHIDMRVSQAVSVGYGKDITCHVPKIRVHGSSLDKGRIHVYTSNDLVVQRCNTRNIESSTADSHSPLEDGTSTRHQPILRFQYQSSDYDLAVVAQRYQALARIARIERIRAEIGISGQQQPGFARIVLSNIVLPQQDDSYLRVYQLDGAEVWNVLVDGKPCSKSIQFTDKKPSGQRTVLIPIPEASPDSDDLHQVEISYGFNTLDRESEDDVDEEAVISTIKLVVPGFSLPVGEYVVVASLPKLDKDVDYDEPIGDFEVMSSLGRPGQRRTITYSAYMTLGRPKLSIKTSKIAARSGAREALEQNAAEALESVGRSSVHSNIIVHDPHELRTNAVVVSQASQRHPQQPLELHNPQAEQGLDGEILPVLSAGAAALSQTSSPQVGSPSNSQKPFTLKGLSLDQIPALMTRWWKPVMAVIAALVLAIMIANVAAFQDTKSTSLDLVSTPMWQRPFAAIGRLWRDSTVSQRQGAHRHEWEESFTEENGVPDAFFTAAARNRPRATHAPETSHGLEVRGPAATQKDDAPGADDEHEYGGQKQPRAGPKGFMKLFELLKQVVRDLKAS